MGRADYYAPGDHNAVCFECGKKFKASTLKRHWQGYYVCEKHWEPRHPQDFVRSVQDVQTPPWVQPTPADRFLWENTVGLITADTTLAATDTAVSVGSSGSLTIYLPATPSTNQILVISNVGTGTVTVDGNGNTIGAVTTTTLTATVNEHFYWDGYTWGVWFSDCAASVLNATHDFGTTTQGPAETAYTVPADTVEYSEWWVNACGETVRKVVTTTYAGRSVANASKIIINNYYHNAGVTPTLSLTGPFTFYGSTLTLAKESAKTYALSVFPVTAYVTAPPGPFTLDTANSTYVAGHYSYGGVPDQASLYSAALTSESTLTLYYLDIHIVWTYSVT